MTAGKTYSVELTAGAEQDLEAIHDYLAHHRSADDANRLLDSFLDRIQTLELYPLRGSVPKELQPLGIREFRQILMGPYRLFYRVSDTRVVILVIADGRRDIQALLNARLLGR